VRIYTIQVPACIRAFAEGIGAGQEVVLDREGLEHLAPFHYLHDALAHELVGRMAVDGSALELDGALGDATPLGAQEPRDRLERGGLAGAVGPEEGEDAPPG